MFRSFTDVTRPPVVEKAGALLDRIYICDFCSDGWSSETEVECHRSKAHSKIIRNMMQNEDRNICKMCIAEFKSESELLDHIKTEHLLSSKNATRVERDIFICDHCSDLFFNKLLLTHHMLSNHGFAKPNNDTFKCPHCFKKIRLNTCWYHFLCHKMQSVAVCKICLLKCRDRLALVDHVKTHAAVYKCDICCYETKRKNLFDAHIQTLHKRSDLTANVTDDKWRRCFMPVEYVSRWRHMYLMGWKGVKLTNDVHVCVLCREICVGVESMQRHVLVDHMVEMQPKPNYECMCGMVFTNKVLYNQHMFKFKDQHNL